MIINKITNGTIIDIDMIINIPSSKRKSHDFRIQDKKKNLQMDKLLRLFDD